MRGRAKGHSSVPTFLAISDRRLCGGVGGLRDWARSLPDGTALQLREKDLERSVLTETACTLRDAFSGPLIVNGDLDVARACGADGVHLPGSMAWAEVAPRARASGLLLGVSTHSRKELEEAASIGADYALFGPVYPSPAKRRFGPPQGLERLAEALEVGLPVLAVGGVDATTAPLLARAGAHGLAAIRAFADPRRAADLVAAWFEAAATIPRP